MKRLRVTLVKYLIGSVSLVVAHVAAAGDKRDLDFEDNIAPLLVKRCLECHNPQKASGELVLTSRARMLAGGETGPAVQPGRPDKSLLWRRVSDGEMPPKKQGRSQKLAAAEIEQLRQWIAAEARWPADRTLDVYEATSDVRAGRDWWSLQPVRRPAIPKVHDTARVANPIDAFVRARLHQSGMQPVPPAPPRALVRRLYFDVVGLPPTAEQIERFSREPTETAYEKLVDGLLDSPYFGQRWARYWLDLVRFAETCGYERDQVKPQAWKYRDWVVRSLNEDKPYDRFVLEQLAGDELADATEQTAIATGFLRLGTWNDEPNDPHEYKYERLEDMVHATSSAFLAMTVKCARCHDHKFDPIPQMDYYRLAAAFWAGPIQPRGRELLGGPSAKELGWKDILGWTDLSSHPQPLHLLKKGNPAHPGPVVQPAHLSLLPAQHQPLAPPPTGAKTSRRRLQLARWIVDPANPLTARVAVNRLWLHHFGQALVRTPNNFGFRGDRPTHPELLDWLASELVDGGWRTKRVHKLILMSQTYRQASVHPMHEAYAEKDFGNRLWWRAERRRLDAEAMRDAMLTVSGQIDVRPGGPSFKPTISPEALEGLSRKAAAWKASPADQQRRRSLYIFTQRSLLPPLMTTFDFSSTTLPCAQRDVTTVATQALSLLNNHFVHEQSEALARRIIEQGKHDDAARATAAWRLAFGRAPGDSELAAALSHLETQRANFTREGDKADPNSRALASLCHVLLNSNEFIYVD